MSRTPENIASTIESFIRSHFRIVAADRTFHRDALLYDSGFVDSAGVVELIAFLESTFEVELTEEDLFGDQFTTINGISGLIHQRLIGNPAIGHEPSPGSASDGPAAAVPAQKA